jgi:hypothetical protein
LTLNDSQYDQLHRELTTMPTRQSWLAGFIGILVTVATIPFNRPSLPDHSLHLDHAMASMLVPPPGPISAPVSVVVACLANFVVGVFIYHTLRQLRLVSRIHATMTRVSLFQRDPLYAFSGLTARTGSGYLLAVSLGILPRSGAAVQSPLTAVAPVLLLGLALATFILPLLSSHRLLLEEKRCWQADLERRIETAMTNLHQRIAAEDIKDLGQVKTVLDSLVAEREILAKIPTWPWRPGMLAGFVSAISLPVIVWLVQQLLGRVIK